MNPMKIKIVEQQQRSDLQNSFYAYKILLDTDYYNDIPIGHINKKINIRMTENDNIEIIYFINLCSKISVQNLSDAKEVANDMINFLFNNLNIVVIPPICWFGNIGFIGGKPIFALEQIAPMNYFYELTMRLGHKEVNSFDKCEKVISELLDKFIGLRNNK